MRRYRTTGQDGAIVLEDAGVTEPGYGEVRVDLRAASRITLQGIYVGPVSTLRSLVATGIAPQIDHATPFEKAADACDALRSAGHVGKIVVRIGA